MKLMRTPRSVDLSVTNRCNLQCTYCSHFTSAGDVSQDLPQEEWLQFFEELNRCAVMNVTLQGGEPFCRKDLQELIEGIVRNRMRFNILSNGTLITDEMAAFLASTGRCDGVQVSIDGSIPMTHDACRGEGNFYKAMRGIKSLQKYNVPVHVRVTIHKHNVRDLESPAYCGRTFIGHGNPFKTREKIQWAHRRNCGSLGGGERLARDGKGLSAKE